MRSEAVRTQQLRIFGGSSRPPFRTEAGGGLSPVDGVSQGRNFGFILCPAVSPYLIIDRNSEAECASLLRPPEVGASSARPAETLDPPKAHHAVHLRLVVREDVDTAHNVLTLKTRAVFDVKSLHLRHRRSPISRRANSMARWVRFPFEHRCTPGKAHRSERTADQAARVPRPPRAASLRPRSATSILHLASAKPREGLEDRRRPDRFDSVEQYLVSLHRRLVRDSEQLVHSLSEDHEGL